MWFFPLFVILFLVLFLLLLFFFFFFFFSSCLCLTDSVTVFYRPVFGHIQSDLCLFYSSTGWAILLLSALSSWSVGAGIFAPYKDIEAREALEILQTYPITFVFFLPRVYIGTSKEDFQRFHFPKLSTCTDDRWRTHEQGSHAPMERGNWYWPQRNLWANRSG